jgi:malonate decarboxylase alpha subunit
LDAFELAASGGFALPPVMIYGDDVTHVITERGVANLLRRRGIVMFPSDLGVDIATATRDWLAAKTIEDLVTASGGLYAPPAKFRPDVVAHG